jgi:hypothetical protein
MLLHSLQIASLRWRGPFQQFRIDFHGLPRYAVAGIVDHFATPCLGADEHVEPLVIDDAAGPEISEECMPHPLLRIREAGAVTGRDVLPGPVIETSAPQHVMEGVAGFGHASV